MPKKNVRTFYHIIFISFLFTSCQEVIEPEIEEPPHFVFEDASDHLPFDQFNQFTQAIFRNSHGTKLQFSIKISEDVVEKQFEEMTYSTNQISFLYQTAFNFDVPNFAVEASIENLKGKGYSEVIKCKSSLVTASVGVPKLCILPNENYGNTILNKEFTWMEEEFNNVYSNILIQENETDKVKIFYQPSIGIIGFVDFVNNSWILDRFE